jgi:hypothetical protein
MSLLLWEFFWTESDWTGAPPSASSTATAVVVLTVPGAGGGGHKKDPYYPLPDEFWEIREHHIRTHVEPVLREVVPLEAELTLPEALNDTPLEEDTLYILQFKRNAALRRAQAATSVAELEKTSARVVKLTLDIREYLFDYRQRALLILFMDLF